MKSQRGSATALALVTMTFIGIMIAGLLTMSSTELKSGTLNKDAIEVQNVAEAGAKRMIVQAAKSTPNFNWINSDIFINNENTKKYKVIAYLESDKNKAPLSSDQLIAALAAGKKCIIESKGTVGKTTKTIFATISNNGSVFSKYVVYAKDDLTISNSPIIKGDIDSGGTLTITNTPTITGTAYALHPPQVDPWHPCLASGGYVTYDNKDEKLIVNIPDADTFTYVSTGTPLPDSCWQYTVDHAQGNYYYNGNVNLGSANIKGSDGKTVNIYIKGNLTSYNTTIVGDNINIYVTGGINLGQTSISGNNIKIYANGKIDINGNSSVNQRSSNGTVSIQTQSTLELTNTATINSELVTLNAQNGINLNSVISINKDSSTAITKIYSGGNVMISNNITVGGSAGLVESKGLIQLSNAIALPTTILVSGSGDSTISNGVDIAGFYTNGSFAISASPHINDNGKKPQIVDILGDILGLGGGEGGGLTISNWKSI